MERRLGLQHKVASRREQRVGVAVGVDDDCGGEGGKRAVRHEREHHGCCCDGCGGAGNNGKQCRKRDRIREPRERGGKRSDCVVRTVERACDRELERDDSIIGGVRNDRGDRAGTDWGDWGSRIAMDRRLVDLVEDERIRDRVVGRAGSDGDSQRGCAGDACGEDISGRGSECDERRRKQQQSRDRKPERDGDGRTGNGASSRCVRAGTDRRERDRSDRVGVGNKRARKGARRGTIRTRAGRRGGCGCVR